MSSPPPSRTMRSDGGLRRATTMVELAAGAASSTPRAGLAAGGTTGGGSQAHLRAALRRATRRLAEAGCETPRLDAELLAAEALGCERARLALDADELLDAGARARFEKLLARRIAREPVAYILGRRAFRRLTVAVEPRVLIPRPESELLVEVGLSLPRGWRVADVGTGSGAIALALKDERPDLDVCGIDASLPALDVARANARRLGITVRFAHADLLDAAPYEAVLANLPYVEEGVPLAPEIACYEPAEALYAGPDGLSAIRRLCARLAPAEPAAWPGDGSTTGAPARLRGGCGERRPRSGGGGPPRGRRGGGRVRALHPLRRGCAVPRRHRVRARLQGG